MPVLVLCDSCSGKYRVPDQHAGKRIKCPKCSSPVTVPAAAQASRDTVPIIARKPSAETVKETPPAPPGKKSVPPVKLPPAKVPPTKRRPDPEPEGEMEPVSQAAPDDSEESPRTPEPPRKKKRRKKPKEPSNTWVWWAGGVGVGLIVAVIAMILIANSGHKEDVIIYAIGLAIMVPISTVILIISMIITSSAGGGIDFGAVHTAIIKSVCLLVAVNIIGMLRFGAFLVFPVWLFGLMYLFGLDLWECRFLIFINWFLNSAVKFFLLAMLVAFLMHGKIGLHHLEDAADFAGTNAQATPEERAADEIDKLGGDIEYAEERGNPVVKVDLAGKQIKDDTLKILKPFTKLRQLDLSNTPVTDAGLVHLQGLSNLSLLTLTNTKVTNAGVQELKKALPNVQVLR